MRIAASLSFCSDYSSRVDKVDLDIVGNRLAIHSASNPMKCVLLRISMYDFGVECGNDQDIWITFKEEFHSPICAVRCRVEPIAMKRFIARLECKGARISRAVRVSSAPHCMLCDDLATSPDDREVRTFFWHVCALLVFTVVEAWLQSFDFASVAPQRLAD